MSRGWGAQSMVAPLRRVIVRPPDRAFGEADPVRWHYAARPDLEKARSEHDELVARVRAEGVEVLLHEEALPDHADAIYVHDPLLITDRGAVVLRMGKPDRRGEEAALGRMVERLGVPIVGRIEPPGTAEGGDLLWLDATTLAVGQGFRTNAQGLEQLRALLAPAGIEVFGVELPVAGGADACLHLMSAISLVDERLAVVYPPLLSVPFYQRLEGSGFELVEVPEAELATQGPNVLALAPRRCLMLEGNPVTRRRLEAAGCEVSTYRGREISIKAEGGPTCLTRPLLRG